MPTGTSSCTHKQAVNYIRAHCDFLSPEEKDLILGDNAARMFRISSRRWAIIETTVRRVAETAIAEYDYAYCGNCGMMKCSACAGLRHGGCGHCCSAGSRRVGDFC